MLLEMHSHTSEFSSCSNVTAVELVRQVFSLGLQGIVITDHHHLWIPEDLQALRRAAEIPGHFVLLSGQEVSTSDFGDVLVYGASRTIARHTPVKAIREMYPEAALVWAHPYRNNRVPKDHRLQSPLLDAIEIFNSNHTVRANSRSLRDWHRLRFTAIAGTDTHGRSYAGIYPTLFDHPVASVEELAGEIRRGRCHPFLKEIPKAGAAAQVMEVTIGAKGRGHSRERIIIKSAPNTEKWNSTARAFEILETLAAHGFSNGSFRVPRPLDADAGAQVAIEQGVRGQSLYEKLISASSPDRADFLQMAGRWLARLHNCRLVVTSPDEFLPKESERLIRYLDHFTESGNPHAAKLAEIIDRVRAEEEQIAARQHTLFVQGHGDYHPKNIFIGLDSSVHPTETFIAAIDFEHSMVLPPAFDVGGFLAQYRNQFLNEPQVVRDCPETIFLDAYLQEAAPPPADFLRQVELFRARGNLGIASYLVNLGLGEDENVWRLLVEAERAIAVYTAYGERQDG